MCRGVGAIFFSALDVSRLTGRKEGRQYQTNEVFSERSGGETSKKTTFGFIAALLIITVVAETSAEHLWHLSLR